MKKSVKIMLLAIVSVVFALSAFACGHVHTYSETYSSNAIKHWKDSTCEHELKTEEGEHTFGASVLNADKTAFISTCTVCGYQKTEQHTHELGQWETVTPATILSEGLKKRECSISGCDKYEESTIEKIAVSSIAITTPANKLVYVEGETFDKTGMVVTAIGVDSSTADITALCTVEDTALSLLNNKVTVSYGTFSLEVDVTVNHTCDFDGATWVTETPATILAEGSKYRVCNVSGCNEKDYGVIEKIAVSSIAITTPANKLVYTLGETFDATGMVVTATGVDNSTADITALVALTGTEFAVIGNATVTVTYLTFTDTISVEVTHVHDYEGATWVTETPATILAEGLKYQVCQIDGCSARNEETIEKIAVASISITAPANKLVYNLGETFDATGMVVTATGVDSSTADVTSLCTIESDELTLLNNKVTVTYGTFSLEVSVTVNHTCDFDGATWVTETPATILAEGSKYRICNVSGCEEKDYDVIEKIQVASISVTTQPSKLVYQIGETFDATGMVVTATGVDSSTADITALVALTGTEFAGIGNVTVTVTYLTFTDTISVEVTHVHDFEGATWVTETPATILAEGSKYRVCNVSGCEERDYGVIEKVEVESISITTPANKLVYNLGETFDATGMVVTATGVDSSTADVTSLCTIESDEFTLLNNKVTVTYGTFSLEVNVTVNHTCVHDNWVTETQATVLAKGLKYSICSVDGCEDRLEEEIEKISVRKLTIETKPTKLNYLVGETFDSTGMVVIATGVDNSTADVSSLVEIQAEAFSFTNNIVVICFGGQSVDLSVIISHVCSYENSSWEIKTPATVLSKGLRYKNCEVQGCDSRIEEEIEKVAVQSIAVTTPANKLAYNVGDKFDATGMVITATGVDGSSLDVTEYVEIESSDITLENNKITVTFETESIEIDIEVVAPHTHDFEGASWNVVSEATMLTEGYRYRVCQVSGCDGIDEEIIDKVEVQTLTLTTAPDKLDYLAGEVFSKKGMVVTATGVDGSSLDATSYLTVEDDTISTSNNLITVSFGGKSIDIELTVKYYDLASAISVTQALSTAAETEVVVYGYYVGVGGDSYSKTLTQTSANLYILVKDVNSDNVIGVSNMAIYGDYPNYGYTYGDLVILKGIVKTKAASGTQNLAKTYVELSEDNPASVEDTIYSKDNKITYAFDNVTTITNWTEFGTYFKGTKKIPSYSYVRITGTVYLGTYSDSSSIRQSRFHMNSEAANASAVRINNASPMVLDDHITANVGTAWKSALYTTTSYKNYTTVSKELDIYLIYLGGGTTSYMFTMLDAGWVNAHDHVYGEGVEGADGALVYECTVCGHETKGHVHEYEGSEWVIETKSTIFEKGVKYRVCSYEGCEKKEYGEVELATAVSIEITQNPNQMYYSAGEKVTDLTGIKVIATADNGTTADVSSYVYAEDKAIYEGDSTVKIFYEDVYTSVTFNIMGAHTHAYEGAWLVDTQATVFNDGLEYRVCTYEGCNQTEERTVAKVAVHHLTITANPTKTNYYVYECFDKSGMIVTATGVDGNVYYVTDYVTVTETPLVVGDNNVVVSFENVTITILVNAEINSVSEVMNIDGEDREIMVKGYFVGVAKEGDTADEEMLIKDLDTDELIGIRNVSYDTFANKYGYTYGDLVVISATLKVETDAQTLGKKYLDFSARNPANIADTIISSGNEVNFSLEDTIDFFEANDMADAYYTSEALNKTGNFYKIIKFQACLFVFENSGTGNFVVHNNTEFTNYKMSKFKTNGKYITLRDDVNTINVGADWKEYFGGDMVYTNTESNYVGPGYAMLVDFYAVYTGGDSSAYQLTILSADWLRSTDTVYDGDYTNVEKLKEVVLAYYRQAGQYQYNQTISRRNINMSPEDVTDQRQGYVDCSSFANAAFYEAFGMNIIQDGVPIVKDGVTYDSLPPQTYNTQMYCEQYIGQDPAVLAVWKKNTDYNTTAKKNAIMDQILANLQPGDVFNYRYADGSSSRGHIMIYLGNDTFFHSRGGDFYNIGEDGIDTASQTRDNAWAYEKCSTISFLNASRVLVEEGDRGLLSKGVICWIRPLARENVTATANTEARMQYQGIISEKTVSVGLNTSVEKGSQITYNLVVENHSRNDYTNIEVREVLDDNVTLVSAPNGYELNGNVLTFKFDLKHFSTINFQYTVKVNDNAPAGARIESMQTTVGGILSTRVYNLVSGYTDSELQAVANKAKELASQGKTYDNAMDLVKELYSDVDGFDGYTTVSSVLDDILDISADVLVESASLSSMIAPDLYGGRQMSNLYVADKNNVRLIKECNLSIGDIIIADYRTAQKDGSGNTVVVDGKTQYNVDYFVLYVYVGNSQLVTFTNEANVTASLNTCVLKTITGDQFKSSNILVTLFAYSRYAIIRPSLVA